MLHNVDAPYLGREYPQPPTPALVHDGGPGEGPGPPLPESNLPEFAPVSKDSNNVN